MQTIEVKSSLVALVVDEADLIFSYGYQEAMDQVVEYLPKIFQSVLMVWIVLFPPSNITNHFHASQSATLNAEVDSLKKLILRNPAVIKLEQSDLPSETQLTQYVIKCATDDKFLLMYALLKLKCVGCDIFAIF